MFLHVLNCGRGVIGLGEVRHDFGWPDDDQIFAGYFLFWIFPFLLLFYFFSFDSLFLLLDFLVSAELLTQIIDEIVAFGLFDSFQVGRLVDMFPIAWEMGRADGAVGNSFRVKNRGLWIRECILAFQVYLNFL